MSEPAQIDLASITAAAIKRALLYGESLLRFSVVSGRLSVEACERDSDGKLTLTESERPK